MSDVSEKTCPLCAEEMDLTDQQLKPCRCGYEICVWCWHHIMDMAEKDETEGRCPACRTPYDKERIVGTASKCERLVAEINMEKKLKSQKAKTKSSDGRKQLSSVRVIQRNLVYIVGLPLNLADEDLLIRKEYFGQYGKVLKVSISRTSAGTIQQFPNNSCSVYITYSKEVEAVRCIQSVHGFNLEGMSLRACFGTTKYCHSWLRNVPCTNPECLYLHEVGSTEDSFTKDEIISPYSRVQQITGISNNVQQRSGTFLPPPADEYTSNGSSMTEKPAVDSATSDLGINARVVSPASVAGRPGILPPAASWASRASHCQSSAGSAVHLNGVSMQKVDMPSGIPMMSSAMAAVTATGTQSSDVGKHVNKSDEDTIFREPKGRLELLEHVKGCENINPRSSVPEISCTSAESSRMVSIGRIPSPSRHFDSSKLVDRVNVRSNTACLKDRSVAADSKIDTSSSETIRSDKLVDCEDSEVGRRSGLGLNTTIHHRNQGNGHNCDPVNMQEHHVSLVSCKDERMTVTCVSHEASSWQADTQASDMKELPSEREHDIGGQCRLDAPVSDMNTSTPFPGFNNLQDRTLSNDADGLVNLGVNPPGVYKQDDDFLSNSESTPIGYLKSFVDCSSRIGSSSLVLNDGIENDQGRPGDKELNPRTDAIENSIISNILSLDLDAWDESLTSPQNLARLLGEPKIQQGPVSMPNSWKPQNSNQSRFSFARQEARSQVLEPEPSFCREVVNPHSFPPVFVGNGEPGLDRHANVLYHNFEPCDSFPGNQSVFSTCKFSVPRAQITAPPPGFSSPSRPPPPGFSVHDKTGRSFDFNSGNHFLDTNFLHKNQYQAPLTTNSSIAADIEFIDPAILAVGKGVIPTGFSSSNLDAQPNFSSHTSAFEQFLMQRTHGAHQSQRYGDIQDHYSLNNTYGFSSRDIESSQPSNMSSYLQFPFQQPRNGSNAHYDAWPDVHGGNNIGIADLLRGDRLGFNKLYGAQEDFQAPNSSDLYGRQFGM